MDREPEVKPDPRRGLPPVDRLLAAMGKLVPPAEQVARVAPAPPVQEWAALEGARQALAEARRDLECDGREAGPAGAGRAAPALEDLAARAVAIARRLSAPQPRRVINATGILLHTNLGRAPLAPGAVEAVAEAAAGYGNLELDLATGRRGNRLAAVREKLVLLTGAEAALVVNNNAAAVLLVLDTLARGRQVIVSRGELVEIGGSFRVPDIMERAGVELVEVGTTNRTHPADYERAVGERTALLLKVHRSNFELRGFVADTSLPQLAEIGAAHGLPVVEDLGSGTLIDLSARGLPAESFAPARLGLGADVVCFSGDKLLGGPQAGIVLGSREIVAAMKRSPMARALRLDKLSLAALDWTLAAYLDGRAESEVPVLRQLLEPPDRLEARARDLAARLQKIAGRRARCQAQPDRALVGGGSLPGFELDTWVVAVRAEAGATRVAEALRDGSVPVIARLRDDFVLFDVRTLLDGDDAAIERSFEGALETR